MSVDHIIIYVFSVAAFCSIKTGKFSVFISCLAFYAVVQFFEYQMSLAGEITRLTLSTFHGAMALASALFACVLFYSFRLGAAAIFMLSFSVLRITESFTIMIDQNLFSNFMYDLIVLMTALGIVASVYWGGGLRSFYRCGGTVLHPSVDSDR